MLKVITEFDSFEKLDKHIDFVNKMAKMKTDKSFQEFMQKKCLETIRKVAEQRFATHTTTNEDLKTEYLNNNKLKDITDDGFVRYNDLSVPKPDTKFPGAFVGNMTRIKDSSKIRLGGIPIQVFNNLNDFDKCSVA